MRDMPEAIPLGTNERLQARYGVWYRNVQRLGTGGNADTYLAIATSGQNRGLWFAIKVFREISQQARLEKFLSEIEFLQECEHPSIMRVYDNGAHQSHPFLVAEYLPSTLRDEMAGLRKAKYEVERISFTLQLLSALAYLNSLDPPAIHRDIKPENILIKGKSSVLGDFGLVKRAASPQDDETDAFKMSEGRGMPRRYRTPDQVEYLNGTGKLTTKSDVFQLGLVVAEMFTGRNPEKYEEDQSAPVSIEEVTTADGVSEVIVQNINRMLIENPDDRPRAVDLLEDWDAVFESAVEQAIPLAGGRII